jgi:hypothetical protein
VCRDGNWAGSTRIYSSRIYTRETKLNSYTFVGMDLYPYPYPPGIRYPVDTRYPPAYYNFSIKHQTTILLHFKIIIIPIALNDNFSTKQPVVDKN